MEDTIGNRKRYPFVIRHFNWKGEWVHERFKTKKEVRKFGTIFVYNPSGLYNTGFLTIPDEVIFHTQGGKRNENRTNRD